MQANDILSDQKNSLERNGTVIREGSEGALLANARPRLDPATDSDREAGHESE
ncbi:hypothetical protein ACLD0W_11960 [Alloalcanivorax sp. C16-1]|uniref:hypothetical protein n=1 Tax=Alloalcanivorax sp. C16-1 TaxID=3390051 RepID=UPI0039709416